jgi:hypothetical protein
MGKQPRIALLLAGTCCLLAVMADWIAEELFHNGARAAIPAAPAAAIPEPVDVVPA